MGLPGVTKEQMVEIDRIMIEDLSIPIELMMEHAGLNLARLVLKISQDNFSRFIIIAGMGNNAGGGIVSARFLASWGLKVQIIFPKGLDELNDIPKSQYIRAKQLGIEIISELPKKNLEGFFIDAFLGYGFVPRQSNISRNVFSFLSKKKNLISLDVPSGLDATTGKSHSKINPIATLTLGFVKQGLLTTERKYIGDLFVADIGIPKSILTIILKNRRNPIFKETSLEKLYSSFKISSIQKVKIERVKASKENYWSIS